MLVLMHIYVHCRRKDVGAKRAVLFPWLQVYEVDQCFPDTFEFKQKTCDLFILYYLQFYSSLH